MNKILFLICLATTFAAPCFSRILPDDPLLYPVLILHEKGSGSGVFLQLSNSVYLVTARHVLFKEPEGTNLPTLLSSKASVVSYSNAGSTNVTKRMMNLDLAQLQNAGEIRFSTNQDVVIVRIEDCKASDRKVVNYLPGVLPIASNHGGFTVWGTNCLRLLADIDVGADVYMFGYPTSLTAPIRDMFDPTQPLLRKGIVAGLNPNKRIIIVDCPSYQGNSGGPVIEVEHLSLVSTSFTIIGLVSSFVPLQEEWENKTYRYSYVGISNSGYTVIVPIDVALEMVWK
jgi:hypothetical protein